MASLPRMVNYYRGLPEGHPVGVGEVRQGGVAPAKCFVGAGGCGAFDYGGYDFVECEVDVHKVG